MKGILFAIAAGIFIAMQQVFNARLGEKAGFWETNTFIHGSGFLFSLIILIIAGNGSFAKIGEANKLYLLGGVLGVLIVFSAMTAVLALGATYSIAINIPAAIANKIPFIIILLKSIISVTA